MRYKLRWRNEAYIISCRYTYVGAASYSLGAAHAGRYGMPHEQHLGNNALIVYTSPGATRSHSLVAFQWFYPFRPGKVQTKNTLGSPTHFFKT